MVEELFPTERSKEFQVEKRVEMIRTGFNMKIVIMIMIKRLRGV